MRLSTFERLSLALLLCAYQTNATYLVPRQDSPSNSSIPTNSTIPSSNSTTPTNSTEDVHKAGLAWANADRVDIEQFLTTGKVSWYYTWSIWPSGIRNLDLEFVPMLWGPKSLTEFESKINDTVRTAERSSTPVTAILGMNEPEQPGQSDMTASKGVEFWKEHMEPLRERFGVRLGSPGVSSAPSAKTWLEDFFEECDADCNVDFIAMHWYGTNPDHFIAHLWDYYFAFNKTIWVTEWACHNFVERREQCEEDEVIEFMNKTQAFMDETPWVERYAWFGALTDLQGVNSDNALLDNKGRISDLGRQYIGEINARGEALDDSGVEPGSSRLTITLTASLVLSIVMLFL